MKTRNANSVNVGAEKTNSDGRFAPTRHMNDIIHAIKVRIDLMRAGVSVTEILLILQEHTRTTI